MGFSFPIPCRCRMCSVAFASIINTGFTEKPKLHIMLLTLFASDDPNPAVYSSASALLLAMILCFFCTLIRRCRPTSATPALDEFNASLSPAQSESEKTVTSELLSRIRKLGSTASPRVPNESLLFAEAVLSRVCLSLAQLVHSECDVCCVRTEEQAPGHMRPVLAGLVWVRPHWILVLHIVNFWSLHCVPFLVPDSQRKQRVGDFVDTVLLSLSSIFSGSALGSSLSNLLR